MPLRHQQPHTHLPSPHPDVGAFGLWNQGGGRLVVRGMCARLTIALLALLSAAVAVSGCGDGEGTAAPTPPTAADEGAGDPATSVPGRMPDVEGVVSEAGVEHRLTQASPPYYEGMLLLGGDPVLVDGETGERLDASELEDGAEVEVWVTGACAESQPVQCGVGAVRVSASP